MSKKVDNFWKNKKVLITGGTGFLGQHVVKKLIEKKPKLIKAIGSKDYDLRDFVQAKKAVKGMDVVIHLAANVGGIGYNLEKPADLFEDNLLMGVNTMKAAREEGVRKYVAIGTICSYPKYTPIPFKENHLFNGYPEETNAPYGLAKLMQLIQAQTYRDQYGFNAVFILPVNLYGPGDNFDPKSSHVIPALMKKFLDSKVSGDEKVEIWGTGKATREFLYVEDAAGGIVLAAEKFDKNIPVNLGANSEISIKELSQLLKELVDYPGKLTWDKTKPDGQPRRRLDTSTAKKEFGFQSRTKLENGLIKTLDWYVKKQLNPAVFIPAFQKKYPEIFKAMQLLGMHPDSTKNAVTKNVYYGKKVGKTFEHIGIHEVAVARAAGVLARKLNVEGVVQKYDIERVICTALTEDLSKPLELQRKLAYSSHPSTKKISQSKLVNLIYSDKAYESTIELMEELGINNDIVKIAIESNMVTGHNSLTELLTLDKKGKPILVENQWIKKIVHLSDDITASTNMARGQINANMYLTPSEKICFSNFIYKYPWMWCEGIGFNTKGEPVRVSNVNKPQKGLIEVKSYAYYQVLVSNLISREIKNILDPKSHLKPEVFVKNLLNQYK